MIPRAYDHLIVQMGEEESKERTESIYDRPTMR